MKRTPAHYLKKSLSWRWLLLGGGLSLTLGVAVTWIWGRLEARHGEVEVHGPVIESVAGFEVIDLPDGDASCSLTVVLYNIRQAQGPLEGEDATRLPGPRDAFLTAIGDVLAEVDPDLVVLNEVSINEPLSGRDQALALAERLELGWYATQADYRSNVLTSTWAYGNAVLSRYPLRDAERISLPARSDWLALAWGHNEGLEVVVDAPTGPVRVIAVHLDHLDEAVRERSAELVAERFEGQDVPPTIVAGDMNALEDSRTIQTLAELPALESAATGNTWSSTDPHKKIDWIFVPSDWEVTRTDEPRTTASDHLPVVVELRAPQCEGATRRRRAGAGR